MKVTLHLLILFVFQFQYENINACEITVFGTQKYVRTNGAPNIFRENFNAHQGDALLVIKNGQSDTGKAKNTITSGQIKLNGVEIFIPNDFKSQMSILQSPVVLEEDNSLHVELAGQPGAFITVEIIQTFQDPTATIEASPLTIEYGNTSNLTWTSSGTESCYIVPNIGNIDFTGSVSVSPSKTTTYTLTASGPCGTIEKGITVEVINPEPVVGISATDESIEEGDTTLLSWDSYNIDKVHIDNGIGSVNTSGSLYVSPSVTTTYTITGTGAGGTTNANVTIFVIGHPEPQSEGSFGAQYNEIIPSDATIDAYDEKRFSLITGHVDDEAGTPLSDVSITIHDHPEYGTALTDTEGNFTIPVEGGSYLTVVYKKNGRLTSQRKVNVNRNDYGIAEIVQMFPVDPVNTEVVFDGNTTTIISHTSTQVTDQFGSRSATMVFTGDNKAFLLDEKGNDVQELKSINVRATEYSTPESMPAKLPPNSAYTYCSELQVDGAERVRFAKPIQLWVDNFLDFDVGEIVPVGYYDRDRAEWIPSKNGVVVRLLDTDSDGIIDALDSTGDGEPNDLNNDGSFSDEVHGLDVSHFEPNTTFWRSEVDHFTPWDCNWPQGPPPDAIAPNGSEPDFSPENKKKEQCSNTNSYVQHKARVFHEDIAIPGTDLKLHYASNRVDGYEHVITVPASGDTVPASVKSIIVKLEIAGNIIEEQLPGIPNQIADLIWNGKDHLGKYVEGETIGKVSIGFVYDAVYVGSGWGFEKAFARPGSEVTGVRSRGEVVTWKRYDVTVAELSVNNDTSNGTLAKSQMGNGWTLSNNHALIHGKLLRRGDGVSDSAAMREGLITTIAGNGVAQHAGDWGPATDASLKRPYSIADDGAGNLFVADTGNSRIRKINNNGQITTVAGIATASPSPYFDKYSGYATNIRLRGPRGVAVDKQRKFLYCGYWKQFRPKSR